MWNRKIFTVLFFTLTAYSATAQLSSTDEITMMHKNAQQYMERGNVNDAISTYKQLLNLRPNNTGIATELGNALYIKGEYEQAITVLSPLPANSDASDSVYRLLALSQSALQYHKKAAETLKRGIGRFPHSGILFFEQGNRYMTQKNEQEATEAWLNGILAAPDFAPNYKNIAASFMSSTQPQWGIICGEQYLLMPHDTAGDDAFKKDLFDCWKNFFNNITTLTDDNVGAKDMIDIYQQLTPVVSDGISVENLTMVRTRFLMTWMRTGTQMDTKTKSEQKISLHTFTPGLFTYQEKLIKEGLFDIYNEWLFGKAESNTMYEAWNKFHPDDMAKFEKWHTENRFAPASLRFIPSVPIIEATFDKKKKR